MSKTKRVANPWVSRATVRALVKKIESYDFECEAGPLKNCLSWIELQQLVWEDSDYEQHAKAKTR